MNLYDVLKLNKFEGFPIGYLKAYFK